MQNLVSLLRWAIYCIAVQEYEKHLSSYGEPAHPNSKLKFDMNTRIFG